MFTKFAYIIILNRKSQSFLYSNYWVFQLIHSLHPTQNTNHKNIPMMNYYFEGFQNLSINLCNPSQNLSSNYASKGCTSNDHLLGKIS